jgi:CRISPR-associated endonuclease Csn1
MNKKILSLDLGITSIGYSVLVELEKDRYSLIDYGVSMFDAPYTDVKKRTSKKLEHSQRASASRLYNLRKKRKKALALLFEEFGLGEKEQFLHSQKKWQSKKHNLIPKWELRAKKAFEAKLSFEELFTIFYTLAKHRGYKSLDSGDLLEELSHGLGMAVEVKRDKNEQEERGKIKQALQRIEELKHEHQDKTVAQLIYEEEMQKPTPTFRNHDNYKYMIRREYIDEEIEKIIQTQKGFGAFEESFNSDEFIARLKEIITYQNESSNDLSLFGKCEYYPDEIVAHQYSLLGDIFKMYQAVANITFDKSKRKISKEEIRSIADWFFAKVKSGQNIAEIKYKDVRNTLKLSNATKIFNKADSYKIKGKTIQNSIIKFHFVSNLKNIKSDFIVKALESDKPYEELKYIFDTLGHEKSPKSIYLKLKDRLDDQSIIDLIRYKSGKSMRISSKAMVEFIPYFEQGYTTDEIKQKLGLNRKEDYSKFLKGVKYLTFAHQKGLYIERQVGDEVKKVPVSQFEYDDKLEINNHPVKSIVSSALRVVKHLHSYYGAFDEVRVESTRELSQNEETRKAIEKANRDFEKEIDRVVENPEYQEMAKHYGRNLRKYAHKILMWEEQDYLDIYTGKVIGKEEIFSNAVDIDHIIPQSLGGLSVKHNLVLVHRDSNLSKSNQVPMNYIGDKEAYQKRVEYLFGLHKINWKKKINLLATTLDEAFRDTFESKPLRATSYIEALTAQMLKRYYPFENTKKQADGSAVRHIQGRATSNIRKVLQVKTKSRNTNIHHAIDAILIGLTNRSWLQKLSNTFRENMGVIDDEARENIKKAIPLIEGIEPKELVEMIEEKYMHYGEDSIFYQDIWGNIKSINFWVSKKPMSSKIHKDTIYANKGKGIYTVREDIIKNFIALDVKPTTEPDAFMKKFEKDILKKMYLYKTNPKDAICTVVTQRANAIKALLKSFEGIDTKNKEILADAKKQIDELIHAPLMDYNGNAIRKVKFFQTNLTGFEIRKGLATKEKSFIGFRAWMGDKKIEYERIDVSNAIKTQHQFKAQKGRGVVVYKNDMVFFIYPDGSFRGGKIVSFLEDKKVAAFQNSRFPASLKYQPKIFCEVDKHGVHKKTKPNSIGKANGVIKLNLDILGNIQSYQVLGDAQSELLEFIKKSIKRSE